VRRVAIVLVDGLRPDAVSLAPMPVLDALGKEHVRAVNAVTIRPSATVAALATLTTGVSPAAHGFMEPGLHFLRRLGGLRPLPAELAAHGLPTVAVTSRLPHAALTVARALVSFAGIRHFVTGGRTALETALAARQQLERMDAGLLFVYLPHCDRAGHHVGWMSPAYLRSAAEVDGALELFTHGLGDATAFVLADHGGGGVYPHDHDLPHPANDRIPLVVAGRSTRRHCVLTEPISIVDIPATALWHLGVPVPETYEGRVLRDAFLAASLGSAVAAA
jgi:predicted AlkP superfamily pyrophosphatase or phosphodiesterase